MISKTIAFKNYLNINFSSANANKSLGTMAQYENIYEIAEIAGPEQKILDWGCGDGHFSAYLRSKGLSPTSYGFDQPKVSPREFHIMADPDQPVSLPFPDNTFDIIFSIGVLEHVHECGGSQEGSLKEISRILKPSGLFVAYHFPNRFSWIEAIANLLKKFSIYKNYTHSKKFDKNQIEELFAEWSIIKSDRYGILPRNIFSRLPKLVSNSKSIVYIYGLTDKLLSKIFSIFAQNYIIVVKKK